MSAVFSERFESGNFTANGWYTEGSPAIVSVPVHSTSYAAMASGPNSYWSKQLSQGYSDLFSSGYVRMPTLPANDEETVFLVIADVTWNYFVYGGCGVDASGSYYYLRVGANQFITRTTIPTNQWIFVQMEYNTNGTANLWINGEPTVTATGQTLTNNAQIVQGGNPAGYVPSGFVSYGDDYTVSTNFIAPGAGNNQEFGNVTIDNILTMRAPNATDFTNIQTILVEDTANPGVFNPILTVNEGVWLQKDAFTNGFFGTDSPLSAVGGGAIQMGNRLTDADDPPRITLTNSADSGGTGATATATVVNGVVTAINVTAGGSGYTSPPKVILSGGTPETRAVATAVLSGNTVASVTVNSGGSGYQSTPTVTISRGGYDTLYITKANLPDVATRTTITESMLGQIKAADIWVHNVNPPVSNTYGLGGGSNYWAGVVADTFYAHTYAYFDALDDLALLKQYKPKKHTLADGTEVDVIDHDSLPFLKRAKQSSDEEEFWDQGKTMGFLIGCLKFEVLAREKLEQTVKELKAELDKPNP